MSHKDKQLGAILHTKSVVFRVWAPFASSVAVAGSFNNWSHAEMTNEGDGCWSTEIHGAEAGQEYKYVIRNGDRELYKNDPRSLQVTTTAGNSVIVDTKFDWEGDKFEPPTLNKQVIYELHIGTFNRPDPSTGGTFETAEAKLDYLADLGINMIELMPITSMSMDRGWGYATDYIYAVESLYGGRWAFLEFVKAAHKRGIGVILDVVYNHFGPDGGLDLWQFDGWSQDNKGGIYFYNDWRSSTAWGETRPDYGRSEVRQYILGNVVMWLKDCHVDGLRVDSTGYIRNVKGWNNNPENDIPEGWSLLQEINNLTAKINPKAIRIAEDLGGNEYITKPASEGGAGFETQWEVTFPHALRDVLDGTSDDYRNISAVCEELNKRYNGDAFQRVIYSDSHDSDANGSQRLSEEISPGNSTSVYARRRSLLASTLILTVPGIPMLFQGQEFVQGGSFNDWQSLDWGKLKQTEGIVLAHRHLIALRKNQYSNTAGLVNQSFNILQLNDNDKVLVYHRWDRGGPGDDVIVAANFSNHSYKDYSINFPNDGIWHERFNSDWKGYSQDFKGMTNSTIDVKEGRGAINLGPYSVSILSKNN